MKICQFIVFIMLLAFICQANGQDVLSKPATYRSVVDDAYILKKNEGSALSDKLDAFRTQTGNELVVVTVRDLKKMSVERYANRLFNNWGIGDKTKNNGILILVAVNEHKMRIETGYGIESVLTDVACARIIDEILAPEFKKNKYYEGLEIASNYIINQLNKGFLYENYALRETKNVRNLDLSKTGKNNQKNMGYWLPMLSWFLCFAFHLLVGYFLLRKKKKNLGYVVAFGCFYAFEGLVLLIIFSEAKDISGYYSTLLISTAFCIFCYSLVLLPKRIGKAVGKISEKVFLAMLLLVLIANCVGYVIGIIGAIIGFAWIQLYIGIVLTLLLFILFMTGILKIKVNSSGGGSSGYNGGSSGYGGGYSDSSSSYSDSSSSYSDSSYGGGSSGGGGASGSW